MNVDCFALSIGLARQSCPCTTPAPEGFDTSPSGLFVADLAPLNLLEGYDSCAEGSAWDLLDRARDQAAHDFVGQVNALLVSAHRLKRTPYVGGIGLAEKRATVDSGSRYRGMRLASANIRSGFLKITKVGAYFTGAGNLTISFVDRLGRVLATRTITTTANAFNVTTLAEPVTLPLFDQYGQHVEYLIGYDSTAAPGLASDTRVTCNCGPVKLSFDLSRPYYYPGKGIPHGTLWAAWVMAGGWQGDALTDFGDAGSTAENRTFGLTAFVEAYCNTEEVLCVDAMNFQTNPLAMATAMAVQHKAAIIAATELIRSPHLTRQNLINRETLPAAIADWTAKYNEYVQYIATNADTGANDCLECRSVVKMASQGVFA